MKSSNPMKPIARGLTPRQAYAHLRYAPGLYAVKMENQESYTRYMPARGLVYFYTGESYMYSAPRLKWDLSSPCFPAKVWDLYYLSDVK